MHGTRIELARERLFAATPAGPVTELPLELAAGRTLARPVACDRDLPPFDRVCMDGYAVRSTDVAAAGEASPVTLEVVGEAAAGTPFTGAIGPGQCTRAMTGAPLPAGADAVVPVEQTGGFRDDRASIHAPAAAGQHVAPRGEDRRAGELLLPAGTVLGPHRVQALASTGAVQVAVHRAPLCAVFSTGRELVDAGAAVGPAQVRDSNGPTLRALLAARGAQLGRCARLPDDAAAIGEALDAAVREHDMVFISGGVSRGEADHVRGVLESRAADFHFDSLHVKPGHPACAASLGGTLVVALPGNPVAVVATFVSVAVAALRRWEGAATPHPATWPVELGEELRRRGHRPHWHPVALRAAAGRRRAYPVAYHGSGDFAGLALADALAWLPDDREEFAAGSVVDCLPLVDPPA